MNYDKLDQDELLRLSLDAINGGRDPEALVMLKTLLERDPAHLQGIYLLAAQHAQLGLLARAEEGFRVVVQASSEFPTARFQLGLLLVTSGRGEEAHSILAPLIGRGDALGAYARALCAAADDDKLGARRELETGLALPQELPTLAADMRRVCDRLAAEVHDTPPGNFVPPPAVQTAPMFLTGYGRNN